MTTNCGWILVLDDDPFIRKTIKLLLEKEGYRVSVASNGRRGIEFIRRHPVDLVVTDIHMPEQDGLEVIMFIRSQPRQPKILCITGGMILADYSLEREAKLLGADCVMTKPFDPAMLLRNVRDLLAGK